MIVVPDANVWISATRFGGTPLDAVVKAYLSGTIAICEEIEEEVIKVCGYKFDLSRDRVQKSMRRHLTFVKRVVITGTLTGICRDQDDDMVLECAIVAGAAMIFTGDKDLLRIGVYRGIRLVSPRTYLSEPG